MNSSVPMCPRLVWTKLAVVPLLCLGVWTAGCTTGAREGAATGAATGLVGGMVAGAVDSLLFGGNVLEGAARGGMVAAAGGAAAGAMAGGMAEKKAKATPAKAAPAAAGDQEIARLRAKYGDLAFQAAMLLVQCQHQSAIAAAERTFDAEAQQERKLFALIVRAAAETETGKVEAAEKTYVRIHGLDASRTVDRARADTLQALLKVQGLRKEHGIPPCGG